MESDGRLKGKLLSTDLFHNEVVESDAVWMRRKTGRRERDIFGEDDHPNRKSKKRIKQGNKGANILMHVIFLISGQSCVTELLQRKIFYDDTQYFKSDNFKLRSEAGATAGVTAGAVKQDPVSRICLTELDRDSRVLNSQF